MGINGAPGQLATLALLQAVVGNSFQPVLANTRDGSLYERWREKLVNLSPYGSTGITNAAAISLEELMVKPRIPDSINGALTMRLPNGEQLSLLGSNSATSDGVDWHKLTYDYDGPNKDEVVAAMRYLTVFDASTLKVVKGPGGKRVSPEGRHPKEHLGTGARLVVITSPFNTEDVETVIAGVNDDQANLETLLGGGTRCFSASSCTTGALMTLLKAIRSGGFDVEGLDAVVMHSNTFSDDGVSGLDLRPSGSGSKSEVGRLLPSIGINIDPSALAIDVFRAPVPVGSLIRAKVTLSGHETSSLIDLMKQGAVSAGNERRVAFSTTPISAFSIRNDRHTATINEDVRVVKKGGSTEVTFNLGFQNEKGYTDGVLDLGSKLIATLKEMDAAGETTK